MPNSVSVPAGQTSAPFAITIVDDNKIDGTQNATITASCTGGPTVSATLSVLDNEATTLALSVPASATEGDAPKTATVSITGILPYDLVVWLASNDTTEGTVPVSVTISAGSTSATFPVTIVEDVIFDGAQAVSISAGATGFTGASGSITVNDNELHHYSINTIASPQARNAPFTATIYAKDINGVTIANFSGKVVLLASGDAGSVPITPSFVTLSSGVWTGSLKIGTFDNDVSITAIDAANLSVTSNLFTVTTGALHHFGFSNIDSPKQTGTAFPIVLTAQDIGNNTVNYSGTAGLSAAVSLSPVTSGSSTATWTNPLNYSYPSSRTQTIYLASELGAAARITALSLSLQQSYNFGRPITFAIRIKTTSLNSYDATTWDSTGWTTVYYRQTMQLSSSGWVSFPFSIPFDYDGKSNLIIDYSLSCYSGYMSAYCYSSTRAGNRTLYANSTYSNPTAWGQTGVPSPTPGYSTYVPDIKLTLQKLLTILPTSTGTFTNGVWNGNVAISASGTTATITAADNDAISGTSNMFSVASALGVTVTPTGGLAVSGTAGGPFTGPTQNYTLFNSGSTSLNWSAGTNQNWMTLSATNGTLPANAWVTVSASINEAANTMGPGDYKDTITFLSSNGGKATRPVSLTVTGVPSMSVTPSGVFAATFLFGGPMTSSTQSYTVTNTGSAPMSWWADETANWLMLSGTTGILAPGASATLTASITSTANILSVGNYADTITFVNATNGGGNTARSATLAVVFVDADYNGLPDAWETQNHVEAGQPGYGPLSDPDGDGIPNLLKYALNFDPKAADRCHLPASKIEISPVDGKSYLTFSYRRRVAGGSGVQYIVEISDDLVSWNSDAAHIEIVGPPTPNADGITETATVRVNPSVDSPGIKRKFVRLRVRTQ